MSTYKKIEILSYIYDEIIKMYSFDAQRQHTQFNENGLL